MKKNIYSLLILTAAGVWSACTPSTQSDGSISTLETDGNKLTLCDFNKVTDTLSVPLSEWVEDCQLVRFENSDTALFKLQWPAITDQYIGIRQSGAVFKLFDREGKFLNNIGAIGQGPGEYAGSLYSEAIDEKNRCVYLAPFFGSNKILKYNLDGSFASAIELGETLNKPKLHLHPDGSLSVTHLCFKGRNEMMVAHIASDGTLTSYKPTAEQIINPINKDGNFVGFNNEIWSYNNTENFNFMTMPTDTLYQYNPLQNRVTARFALQNQPKDKDVFLIYNELPGKFLATVWGTGTIAIDLQKQQSHYVKLVNDYFGGLPIPMNFTNGYFFAMYEPLVLMDKIEERLSAPGCTDKDKEVLNKLLDSLDENDNNVMFIGKLKH